METYYAIKAGVRLSFNMNDLPWIKYLPKEMFLDTVGMTASGERAHRRLCDYIWFNDGPPQNDNEVLKYISQTSSQDWGRTKLELLGKGWMEREGHLLHRRAVATLNEAKEVYVSNQNRPLAASNARPGAVKKPLLGLTDPNPKTGVRNIVTLDVTPNVTLTQEQVQEQPQEEPSAPAASKAVLERGSGGETSGEPRTCDGEFPEANLPMESEVAKYGARIGATPATCKAFFDHHQNQQLWLNQHQRLIDWRRKLATWRDEDRQPKFQRGRPNAPAARERLKENLQSKTL